SRSALRNETAADVAMRPLALFGMTSRLRRRLSLLRLRLSALLGLRLCLTVRLTIPLPVAAATVVLLRRRRCRHQQHTAEQTSKYLHGCLPENVGKRVQPLSRRGFVGSRVPRCVGSRFPGS